jgi:transcription antitermination factor NusG
MLTRLFVHCVLVIGCVCLSSLALSNTLTYITYSDGVGITGCVDSSCPSELIIPEMIDGKTVTRIEDGAFAFTTISSITIPDSILHIGEEALVGNNLDSIILPNSVVSIVNGTFDEFEGDLYILKPADQNLNVFDFPADANLYACDGLNEEGIAVNCEEAYPDVTRNLLDYDTAQALIDSTGHAEIPNTYTMIEGGAFSFGGISSITIPDSILHIGEEALVGNNLDSIILPNSVVSIVNGTFDEFEGDLYILKPAEQNLNVFDFPADANLYACDGLDENGSPINCEDAYPGITRNLLDYDTAQALIDSTGHAEIPNTYTMIEGGAFSFGGITSITIPDSILHIGEEVFYGNNLDSIILPNLVVSIVNGAFDGFEGDIYIIKPADQYVNPYDLPHTSNHFVCESVDSSGNPVGCEDLWQSTTSVNTQFTYNIIDGGIELTGCVETCPSELVIPDEIDDLTVISIGVLAFYDSGLTSVTLPETIANIRHAAFMNNPGQTDSGFRFLPFSNNATLLGCELACPSELVIPDTIAEYTVTRIESDAFRESQLTSVSLPDTIEIIDYASFEENQIVKLVLPRNITKIYGGAFSFNPLTEVFFLGNMPIMESEVFYDNDNFSASIYYCPETTGWPGDPIEGITPQLDENCNNSDDQYAILDIDQNGSFDALTDGLILLRYAFGLRGGSLIDGVIDTNANRTTAAEIEAHIQSLVP